MKELTSAQKSTLILFNSKHGFLNSQDASKPEVGELIKMGYMKKSVKMYPIKNGNGADHYVPRDEYDLTWKGKDYINQLRSENPTLL